MMELALAVAKFGPGVILIAAIVFLLIHGEFQFRYPRADRSARRAGSRKLDGDTRR
jgi:hypothetical protein